MNAINENEQIHYINNDFNKVLCLMGLSEERALYVLIKALKKRYNQCIHWGYEDKEVIFINGENDEVLIKKFNIPMYDIMVEFKKAKIPFEDTKDLFEKLPIVLKRYQPNGGIRRTAIFSDIYYKPEYNHMEVTVSDVFYDCIKLENLEMDRFFKIYHNEFFKLTGKHSRSMYRLASMFENNTFFTYNLNTLMNYFLKSNQNIETKYFIRDIIDRSIKEVERKTKFKISYKKVKKGRQLDKLTFVIKREQ